MSSEKIYSKVILCGEHAVLRGGMALVAPLKKESILYSFSPAESFSLLLSEHVAPYEILIQGTLEKALSLVKKTSSDLKLCLKIQSLVPLGKGLGGSAAVSVLIAKTMQEAGFLKDKSLFSFAVDLENMFHGESSGVDVVGCLSDSLVTYTRGSEPEPLNLKRSQFYFSVLDTGELGGTEDAVAQVLEIKKHKPDLFNTLDHSMNEASLMLKEGLLDDDASLVKKSFLQATYVYNEWGLISSKMTEVMDEALSQGALCVKPTGSGNGGFILACWDTKPEDDQAFQVIY